MRRGRTGTVETSISVTNKHAAFLVHGFAHEIKQVAARVAPALHPDATTLDRISRGRINRGPGLSCIECVRNVEMPFALEVRILKGPAVGVPRKANAARSSSPGDDAGKG
jgi:hypothetical protein